MIVNDQGAIVVIGDVILSAWRRPYQMGALDDIARTVAEHDPNNTGRLSSVSLYRFDRVRASDFADVAVRKRMVELSRTCRYRKAINILDGPGLVSGTIRLAFAGLMTALQMPYPVATVDSIEDGIAALDAGIVAERAVLMTAFRALERSVWREPAPPR